MTRQSTILIAEDDPDLRAALAAALRADGHEVLTMSDGSHVQSYVHDCMFLDIARPRVDALVVDLCMPCLDGLTLLAYLRQLGWHLPTILVTGYGCAETAQLARELGAHAILDKPIELEDLQRCVRAALRAFA